MRDDGQALLRRRIEIGNIAHARERHIKRARNGRGGKSEHIHFGAKFFEMLLVRHAKTLLFINDNQTKIL